jgi:hypothetical protein
MDDVDEIRREELSKGGAAACNPYVFPLSGVHHDRPSFTLADTTFHFLNATPAEALRQAKGGRAPGVERRGVPPTPLSAEQPRSRIDTSELFPTSHNGHNGREEAGSTFSGTCSYLDKRTAYCERRASVARP